MRNIFTIRIIYKSGYAHDFEVYDFKFGGGNWEWTAASDTNKPLRLGVDEIAAVWQVGHRQEEV